MLGLYLIGFCRLPFFDAALLQVLYRLHAPSLPPSLRQQSRVADHLLLRKRFTTPSLSSPWKGTVQSNSRENAHRATRVYLVRSRNE